MGWMRNGMVGAVVTGAAAVAVVPSSVASTARAHATRCVRASNIEAIIDDSGSMIATDQDKLRVKGLKLLINTLNPGTFLGAVEFGGKFSPSDPSVASDTVFSLSSSHWLFFSANLPLHCTIVSNAGSKNNKVSHRG